MISELKRGIHIWQAKRMLPRNKKISRCKGKTFLLFKEKVTILAWGKWAKGRVVLDETSHLLQSEFHWWMTFILWFTQSSMSCQWTRHGQPRNLRHNTPKTLKGTKVSWPSKYAFWNIDFKVVIKNKMTQKKFLILPLVS